LDPTEYDYLFELEDNLWWFVGMRRIVDDLMRRHLMNGATAAMGSLKVLDAGCGTGGQLKQLEPFGQVTSFDFERKAAEMFATRQRGRILVASTDAVPFADATFDIVTSFDVVCQLESPRDETAMAELARVLKPGGGLILRVPAFQALYGPHDVTLHTKHRYSTGEITTKLEKAGLRVVHTTYANTFLFPVAVARRTLAKVSGKKPGKSDVRDVPAPLNQALTAVLRAEAEIIKRTSMPFGLSVIALAKKP
jgi:SAM-dependent methyltransferase